MSRRETVILHDFGGGLRTGVTERFTKGGKGGKFTVDVEATPLVHTFDDRALAAAGAEALVDALRDDFGGQPVAAEATREKRNYHARRWRGLVDERAGSNRSWLQKMYSGGRTGETPPKSGVESPRRWSGSSRLFQTVTARWVDRAGAFIVNVAANRLKRRELATKFAQDMPTLENLAAFSRSPEFKKALAEGMGVLIAKAGKVSDAKRVALRQKQLAVARGLLDLGKALGGG